MAYSVSSFFGIKTDANSFGYIANYVQGKSINDLKNSLDLIAKTADEIISDIERNYAELMKDREAEINVDELPLPEPPEVVLEPMPDPSFSLDVMRDYGYTDADMLPLSKDRALELAERDVTVYMLYSDNSEAMVFDTEDIVNYDGLFGITREDWDAIKADVPVHDRDIVAENPDHVVSYISGNDSELPDFGKESPLKNAEMLLEDDYSMLDGRINNSKSALAEDKKPSVLEQLKAKDTAPKTPKPPKKTKEHEL